MQKIDPYPNPTFGNKANHISPSNSFFSKTPLECFALKHPSNFKKNWGHLVSANLNKSQATTARYLHLNQQLIVVAPLTELNHNKTTPTFRSFAYFRVNYSIDLTALLYIKTNNCHKHAKSWLSIRCCGMLCQKCIIHYQTFFHLHLKERWKYIHELMKLCEYDECATSPISSLRAVSVKYISTSMLCFMGGFDTPERCMLSFYGQKFYINR